MTDEHIIQTPYERADRTIDIIPMDISHMDAVFEIERHSFASPWTRESLVKDLTENENTVYLAAVVDGAVAGYAGMWHIVNEGHITNVAVDENYRRNGVGRALVSRLVEIALERGMMGLTLEVSIANLPAQRLYARFGFKPEGFRKDYYKDTHEDAVIMWKYLT